MVTLGVEGDPGWDAIANTYSYIQEELMQSREEHIAAENAQLDAETSTIIVLFFYHKVL